MVCCRAVCFTQRHQCSLVDAHRLCGELLCIFCADGGTSIVAIRPYSRYHLRSRFLEPRHTVLILCARLPPRLW